MDLQIQIGLLDRDFEEASLGCWTGTSRKHHYSNLGRVSFLNIFDKTCSICLIYWDKSRSQLIENMLEMCMG